MDDTTSTQYDAKGGERTPPTPLKTKGGFFSIGRRKHSKQHLTKEPQDKPPSDSQSIPVGVQLSSELSQSPVTTNDYIPTTEVWFDVSSTASNMSEQNETISRLKNNLKVLQNKFEDEERCRRNAERLCEELTREQEALKSELKLAEEDSQTMQSLYDTTKERLSFYETSGESCTGPKNDGLVLYNDDNKSSQELPEGNCTTARDNLPESTSLKMVQELQTALEKERLEKHELFDSTQSIRGQLQEKESELEQVKDLLKQREEANTEMDKLLKQREEEHAKMETIFKELLEEKSSKHEEALQTISRFENELLSVEAQLTKERQEKYEHQKKLVSLGANNRKLNERIESCQNRIETYLNQLQLLERENKELTRSKGTLEGSNEDFKQALQCLHNASVKLNVGKPASFNVKDYSYEPEIRDYLNWVAYGIVDKWQSFAYQLKLSDGTVRTIMATYGSKPMDCCREVFVEWKNKKTSPFMWCTLLTALLSPSVGRPFIASLVVAELNRIHYC